MGASRIKVRVCLVAVIVIGILFLSGSFVFADDGKPGWSGDVFLGYNKTNGNTQKSSGSLAASAAKKFGISTLSFKGNIFYSESNKKMDGQKWDLLGKYSFDFGKEKKWFNFYQTLVDHDYFADINYRVTPAAGLGYHIANTESWVWDADAGLGYRITRHRIDEAADDEVLTAVAHTFMKKKVFSSAALSEDFTVYPGLESDAGVTLRSETAFSNALSESLSLELKYILDYNSEPVAGKKKSDTQVIAGLTYRFK